MSYYRPQQSWRDHYNPLRGVSMAQLLSMEDAYHRGDHADLQWFRHHMLQTDVTVALIPAEVKMKVAEEGPISWIRLATQFTQENN